MREDIVWKDDENHEYINKIESNYLIFFYFEATCSFWNLQFIFDLSYSCKMNQNNTEKYNIIHFFFLFCIIAKEGIDGDSSHCIAPSIWVKLLEEWNPNEKGTKANFSFHLSLKKWKKMYVRRSKKIKLSMQFFFFSLL